MYEQLLLRVKEIDIEDIDTTKRLVSYSALRISVQRIVCAWVLCRKNGKKSSTWKNRITNAVNMLFARKLLILCVLAMSFMLFVLIHMVVEVGKMQVAVFAQSTVCSECSRKNARPFPRILHHTWKNATIPAKWKNSTGACKTLNPNYRYMFWTDRDIENLILKEYPWFWDTYRNYQYNIQRADAGRYFILYHYGGVYADLDIQCKFPFDQILENVTHYDIVLPQGPPIGVTAEVMFAKPRHRFLELVIHSLEEANQWRVFPYATIIFSTGPMFMSNCLMKYEHKDQFYIIPHEIYSEKLFINLHGGSWHEWDGDFIFWVYTHRGMLFLLALVIAVFAVGSCRVCRRKQSVCPPLVNGYHGHYAKLQLS